MSEKKEIKIAAAKGRPMLTWVGKRPLRSVTAFPAQHVETFSPADVGAIHESPVWKDWPAAYPQGGLLFHGDNKEVLGHLLANGFRGKVKLIYIDPPFDSGADYVRKVQLRGGAATAKIDGESYALGEQIQYTDIWANDNYLQFMYERLMLLRELLAEDGSIYLHCDQRKQHHLRCILDEIFGSDSFRNQISRIKCNPKNFERTAFGNIHDIVFFYAKGQNNTWNDQVEELDSEDMERLFGKTTEDGKKYTTVALHASGERKGPTGEPWRGIKPPPGRHWAYVPEMLDKFDDDGRIEWSSTGNPRLILYAEDQGNRRVQDVWTMKDPIYSIYPTEKNNDLLCRIIHASTRPGDLILDCFIGSGTTAAVAQKLGRRWIGCDINKGAIQTTAKRLQGIMVEQARAIHESPLRLPGMESGEGAAPAPTQLSFTVWRVNDYDLKIQRNEAIQLACEHVGVERLPSDSFFDGKLGKKLVKIVPFEHPLSPLDLEELKRELEARPELENTVVFVCLGIELAARTWIEDWNRLRKGAETVNKIEVIELRTDEKYGNFIKHEPAAAKVAIARAGDSITVTIEDFISPTILKRLDMDTPLFKAKIADWRSQIDCVMVDTAYDGAVFNVVLADVPAKKTDLIDGAYTLPAPEGKTTVAVKIVDMLGEEVLVTEGI
ncbi:site-specific DNA-methyltransferase [Desulfuromonas acetexigens]|uniref:Site-specific DNA-methyltransferase n=1 Tax=Trichloromonas acetexigens TaxID=38815 RepID=A0A550J623_9BACT|nr:site-specific DNA-methyltransferase [Desulfuromonas acetexigens]TRO78718.1 site-specific DNA-methyltransferase [Desulfuromonas acetexigens]